VPSADSGVSGANTAACVSYVQSELAAQADPEKAEGMATYMKTDMPFYGVQKPARTRIRRHIEREFAPASHDEYKELVTALWELPHREEKYLAQGVATTFRQFIVPESLPIYERFIDEGAWWDFVDDTATHMIRELVLNHPEDIWPVVDGWIDHQSMWRRRSAIICQIGAKEKTDAGRLFRFCEARAHETEFFIRKAIGWALREYAKTDPEAVARFVNAHRAALSGLSFREATKHIGETDHS
jgi:3-methyladenine DNA glycosylase AlkD